MAKTFWDESAPFAIAHRGGDGAGKEKENTLVAFQAASDLGYKYAETDVVLTADGQVIAVHGSKNRLDSLLKKHKVPRPVLQKMTLKQIRSQVNAGGEPIPLLKEVLTAQPNIRFFIDPKTDEVVEPLAKLLKQLNVVDRVSVNSFNYGRLQRLLGLLEPNEAVGGVIIGRGVRLRNKNLARLKEGKLENISYVHLHHSHVSKSLIDLAHSQSIKVFVWTCNSLLSIRNAVNCGADGIISDDLKLLKHELEKG